MQAVDLNSFDLMSITGPDARKFLQGQVTCDVNQLSPSRSLTGALCNLKGRVIGSFRLVEHNDVCYLLLSAGMGPLVKQVLDKYIVFFKAQCLQLSGALHRVGLIGSAEEAGAATGLREVPDDEGQVAVSQHGVLIKIPGAVSRFELWQFAESADPVPADAIDSLPRTTTAAWDLEDIRAGILHITPDLSEQHLPEALNYDLSGVINFRKGCYTGQEIIARMYYRGTAKKRLFHGCSAAPVAEPASGAVTIYCQLADAEVPAEGEVLKALCDADGILHLLAILPVSAIDTTSRVSLDREGQLPVRLDSLPDRIV